MGWRGVALGGLLLAGYALPLFAPPVGLSDPAAGAASWLQRIFPGVPTVWIAARLACLFGGAVLIGGLVQPPRLDFHRRDPRSEDCPPSLEWLVLAAATVCAAAALFADRFTRPIQLGFIAALWMPAIIALLAAARTGRIRNYRIPLSAWGVVLTWSIWRLSDGLGSTRRADPVDTLMSLNEMALVSQPTVNLLTEGSHTGVSSLHLTFHGTPLFTWFPHLLSLEALQFVNVAWFAVAALLIAALLSRTDYKQYAPVGAAMMLFSPFALLAPLIATPLYLGALQSAALLFLLLTMHDRRSTAGLLAFAALAGIGLSHPATAPTSLTMLALAALIIRRCGFSMRVVAAAALVLVAAAYPGLPSLETLGEMTRDFATGKTAWLQLEPILLGQAATDGVANALEAGQPGPLDVPLGTLLSPFAIPRTALRLWGDALYEPITSALVAVALIVCVRQHSLQTSMLAAFLLISLATGLLSSYDRPSLTRTMSATVPMALLGVYGFAAMCAPLDRRRRGLAIALTTLAIAASGTLLFDRVNPTILQKSANALALEAFAGTEARRTWILTHAQHDWLRTQVIAAEVPTEPLAVFGVLSTGSLEHLLARPVERFAWSPGLEADFSLRRELCRLRPDAVVFDVVDPAGLSRVHVATLGRTGWSPSVPRARWSSTACSGPGSS